MDSPRMFTQNRMLSTNVTRDRRLCSTVYVIEGDIQHTTILQSMLAGQSIVAKSGPLILWARSRIYGLQVSSPERT